MAGTVVSEAKHRCRGEDVMITHLDGMLIEKHPTRVVMDLGGVGYEVFIPLSSYDRLPRKESLCRLLTYDYIREDTHTLYGFATDDERRMFVLLLSTSGIGPKLALSALSGMTVRELKRAILDSDVKRLSSISGVGKKMAERIVVDVRDKIDPGEGLEATAGAQDHGDQTINRDAVLALIALGYKQDEARKMITTVCTRTESTSVEELIKMALSK
jgi:Holliday junction DNA helicase RuvA